MIYDITNSTHDIKAIISHLTCVIWQHIHCISVITTRLSIIKPHCMYDNTATKCMTSYELPMTSHPLFIISYQGMTSHPLYPCHHTQDTCHRIHSSWTIRYSVLIITHLLYVWHETHYMYGITGILYDITCTLYDITILYSWRHIHSNHDSTPIVYDITYSILVTSQPLNVWEDTSYVYDIIHCIYDISHGVWKKYNHSIWHHAHSICVITPTWLMISHPMYVWNHTHCM